MSFPSIRIEGGLLGPELLDQVIAADVPGQKPADFGLEPKRNLTDEIAAAFADSRAQWGIFKNRLARLPDDDLATTVTRDTFVIPFLGLLGYELTFNARAHEVDGMSFAVSHGAGAAARDTETRRKAAVSPSPRLPSPRLPTSRPFTSSAHGRNLATFHPADARASRRTRSFRNTSIAPNTFGAS